MSSLSGHIIQCGGFVQLVFALSLAIHGAVSYSTALSGFGICQTPNRPHPKLPESSPRPCYLSSEGGHVHAVPGEVFVAIAGILKVTRHISCGC